MVGEIYDEDDEDDFVFAEDSITYQEDGTFQIRGDADLEDVDAVLDIMNIRSLIGTDLSVLTLYFTSILAKKAKSYSFCQRFCHIPCRHCRRPGTN